MSSNISNNNVSVRIGSVIDSGAINFFQTLTGDTLNIVGPSYKGKAFVPQNITDVESTSLIVGGESKDFEVFNTIDNIIGEERKNRYRHLNDSYSYLSDNQSYDAVKTWLDGNASQASFTRILGIGSGLKNVEGKYIGSGFNLENQISSDSSDNLTKTTNPQSNGGNIRGNLTFLMTKRESLFPGYIEDLGLDPTEDNYFIDRVIFSADNILPSLVPISDSTQHEITEGISTYENQIKTYRRSSTCSIELLGLNSKEGIGRNVVNISDDMNNLKVEQYSAQFNASKENYWPERFLNRGHLVYTKFPNCNQLSRSLPIKIITTRNYSSLGNSSIPDYNSFESSYKTAKTPWVTSQPVNRSGIDDNRVNIQNHVVNLFRFHSLDDGEVGNRFRIKINITHRGNHVENLYSKFDIYLFEYEARNNTFIDIGGIKNVDLNPDSKNYICRLFGDENTYYDIENKKVVTKFKYERRNKFLRVEVHPDVENKVISPSMIPSGFRAYPHIRINPLAFPEYRIVSEDNTTINQMPLLYSMNYFTDEVLVDHNIENNWGVVFLPTVLNNRGNVNNKIEPLSDNNTSYVSPHYYFTKYFLNGMNTETKNIWVEDDSYLNSFFHLEKIYYDDVTIQLDDLVPENLYYSRKANQDNNREYLNLDAVQYWDNNNTLIEKLEDKLSFDFFTYGGFDGFDIRDKEKRLIKNEGLVREVNGEDLTLSLQENPLFCAYNHGIDIATNDLLGGDILCLPGISNLQLAEKCINICEDKKNIIYISDISTFNAVIVDNLLQIENQAANYILNNENVAVKEKEVDTELFPALEKSLDDNFVYMTERLSDSTKSRFFIPLLGTLSGDKDGVKKRIDPSLVAIQKASTFNPLNIASEISPREVNGFNLTLLNSRLDENLEAWDLDSRSFREKKINVLYKPLTVGDLKIETQSTRYDVRDSFFSNFKNMRTLNLIKKEIKFNLFTQNSVSLNGPLLFAQNSKTNNIRQILDLQLRSILNNFIDRGLITDYVIDIPSISDDKYLLDLQNYIIRGTIILKFNNTSNDDIINLKLDDIISELSLLSDQSSMEIAQPIF